MQQLGRILREGEAKSNQSTQLYTRPQLRQQIHVFRSVHRCHVLLKGRCLRTVEEEPFRRTKERQAMRYVFEGMPVG